MWNRAGSNKHLDKLSKQEAYRKHISTVYHVKSTIDNKPPKKYQFLTVKAKAKVQNLEREMQIQQCNQNLVHKIRNNPSSVKASVKSVYTKDSLNKNIVEKKKRQIEKENKRLVQKLQNVTSQYGKEALRKDMRRYDDLRSQLANSRMGPVYDLVESLSEPVHVGHRKRPRTAK